MKRLTYKSMFGDYGSKVAYPSTRDEIENLRNALGKYEDLGYTPEELKSLIVRAQAQTAHTTVDAHE